MDNKMEATGKVPAEAGQFGRGVVRCDPRRVRAWSCASNWFLFQDSGCCVDFPA